MITGELVAWDEATYRNTVLVDGAELVDLPVLGRPVVRAYSPGKRVALLAGSLPTGATLAIVGVLGGRDGDG